MRRRKFISLVGGAVVAWPAVARAQQAVPVVGFLSSSRVAAQADNLAAFRVGLKDAGFSEGQNVAVEYRWANDQFDRLQTLAAELIQRPVALIFANGLAAFRANAATNNIPIVFTTGSDPVRDGLVTSLNRPSGNVTGVVFIIGSLATKRLELLHQLVPRATGIAAIVNPNTAETESERRDLQAAAQKLGQKLIFFDVTSASDIDAAFAAFKQRRATALIVGAGAFLFSNREQIVALATRNALPAIYPQRESAVQGGLMSYGTSAAEAYRLAGTYVGRILKGERPADLPVVQSSKFEFVINLKTAKALGLEFHPQLLATADEVIE